MVESLTGGKRAVRQGNRLEQFAAGQLIDKGYEEVHRKQFFSACLRKNPIFSTQCIAGESIYLKPRKVDIILYHPQLWKESLVVQCKWQASAGSVDEKYPFEVLSIEHNRFDTIIILDGGGYSSGAKKWLIKQVDKKNRLLAVLDQGDFARFAKNRL